MKKTAKQFIAADCGGSGGKALMAAFDGERLHETAYENFPNTAVRLLDHAYCDVNAVYRNMLAAFGKLAAAYGGPDCIGIDTHGGLHFLLDSMGRVIRLPYHRSDTGFPDLMDRLYAKVSGEEIFRMTGSISSRGFTLPWLLRDVEDPSGMINEAQTLLMFSDLLNYFFSGVMTAEKTSAGTSCLVNAEQTD